MNIKSPSLLQADRPIQSVTEDLLGFRDFAKHLAQSLIRKMPTEGFVVAIHGKWGMGKSSLLNLIAEHALKADTPGGVAVVRYDPWWFSGQDDLARSFFMQLRAELTHQAPDLAEKLNRSFNMLAAAASKIPHVGVQSAAAAVDKATSPWSHPIPELKARIREKLLASEKTIVVMIDDIDRLTSDEIRQLFRLVKAIADFPNVIYVVAFDRGVVVSALESEQGTPGDAYLEKIVQVPFELPAPSRQHLAALLTGRLEAIIGEPPDALFSERRWNGVFIDGIMPLVTTPRDVARYCNTLLITYDSEAIRDEVNVTDFLAIEALRVFEASVYETIRDNQSRFAPGPADQFLSDNRKDMLKEFHEAWLKQVAENRRPAVQHIVGALFPSVAAIMNMPSDWTWGETNLRASRRIASHDLFALYFRLSPPSGSISHAEISDLICSASDPNEFKSRLLAAREAEHGAGTKVGAYLDWLREYSHQGVPNELVDAIIAALIDIGDDLLLDADRQLGFFEENNEHRLIGCVWNLTRRIPSDQRAEVFKGAIETSRSLFIPAAVVARLDEEHGKLGSHRVGMPQVDETELAVLEAAAAKKIQQAAKSGVPGLMPETRTLIGYWYAWQPQEAASWTTAAVGMDTGLAQLLEACLWRGRRLDPRWFDALVPLDNLVKRVQELKEARLTDKQQFARSVFLKEYEMLQQGQDPTMIG